MFLLQRMQTFCNAMIEYTGGQKMGGGGGGAVTKQSNEVTRNRVTEKKLKINQIYRFFSFRTQQK